MSGQLQFVTERESGGAGTPPCNCLLHDQIDYHDNILHVHHIVFI